MSPRKRKLLTPVKREAIEPPTLSPSPVQRHAIPPNTPEAKRRAEKKK